MKKVRLVLTQHNFHYQFLKFCNWKCISVSKFWFDSHKSHASTVFTLTFRFLLQFQHQCCTCRTSISNITKAFAALPLTAAPSIQIGSCNIHTLLYQYDFITNKMHCSTSETQPASVPTLKGLVQHLWFITIWFADCVCCTSSQCPWTCSSHLASMLH